MIKTPEVNASYAQARNHFLKTAATRSQRAALLDTWRSRKRVLSPQLRNSALYLEDRGPLRADFWHVDDGSPQAKAIFNSQRYREPKRNDRITEKLKANARQIGNGKEATVWRWKNGRVVKLFDDNVPVQRIKDNAAFLKRNPAATPRFYKANYDKGYLLMSELRDYKPFSSYFAGSLPQKFNKDKTDPAKMAQLLRQLALSRVRLGKSTEFKDLTKLDNIAVKFRPDGFVSSIKFYEGGRPKNYNDTERAADWFLEMVQKLHLVREPFAQQVANYQVPWIR